MKKEKSSHTYAYNQDRANTSFSRGRKIELPNDESATTKGRLCDTRGCTFVCIESGAKVSMSYESLDLSRALDTAAHRDFEQRFS